MTVNYLTNVSRPCTHDAAARCSHGPVGRWTHAPQTGRERNAPQARGYSIIVDFERALDASAEGGLS